MEWQWAGFGAPLLLNEPDNACGCIVLTNNRSEKEKKKAKTIWDKDRNQSLLNDFRRESRIVSHFGVKI